MEGKLLSITDQSRNPLSALSSLLTRLKQGEFGQLDNSGQDEVDQAIRNIAHLGGLIADVVGKDESMEGMAHIEKKNTALDFLLADAVEAVESLSDEKNIIITIEDTRAQVCVDVERIMHVIVKLLSNAIKFSPEESTVQISVVESPHSVEVRIRDQGPGIPEHMRELIFYRPMSAQTGAGAEQGGGLATCREFIEQHDGAIGVKSQIGSGSTFWFRLQAEEGESRSEEHE